MKKLNLRRSVSSLSIAALVSGSLFSSSSAFATYKRGSGFVDYANVTDVQPVYETVVKTVPVERCWNERVKPDYHRAHGHHRRNNSATPALLGAIIGGALGNELGHRKRNKQFGVAIGGILGASIGQDIGRQQAAERGHYGEARHSANHYRVVERCGVEHERYEEQELVGYEVSYRYRGNHYSTVTDNHPGDKLKVHINVLPVTD